MGSQPRPGARSRVLVTRPEPGATATARKLAEMGFQPVKLPLHETRPLAVSPDIIPRDAVAVALPSAAAVRLAPKSLIARLCALPCRAVGEATAQAAREAGFQNVVAAGGDAESLADMLIEERPPGTVAYLCGRVRRPVFQQRMEEAGFSVIAIEIYDTMAIDRTALSGALGGIGHTPFDHVLVYSVNAGASLADAVADNHMEGMFADAAFICISRRVAEAIVGIGSKILIATEPAEAAMLKLLADDAKQRAQGPT